MSDKKEFNAYDDSADIKENRGYVPLWFSVLFYGSIIIGTVYGLSYHFIYDWSQKKEYAAEVESYQKEKPAEATALAVELSVDGTNPLRGDKVAIAEGEKTFKNACAACHGMTATGVVGPNLVDKDWLHGNTDKALYTVIMEGVTAENAKQKPYKGPMLAHKASLGAKKVLEVMAWLAEINPSFKAK